MATAGNARGLRDLHCLSFREIAQSIILETVAQPEFGICLAAFRAWLWKLEREGCFCCSPENMQHVKMQGCKKHLRPALRASRPEGELEARTRHVAYSNSQIGTSQLRVVD